MANTITSNETNQNSTKGNEMESNAFTGWKLHKEANKVLEKEGLATIKPQMVYNYINNKLIPSYATKDDQRLVKREDGLKWIEKYVKNKKARQNA